MLCTNCNAEIDNTMHYCPHCGQKTETILTCGQCGTPLPEKVRFCPSCGARNKYASTQSSSAIPKVQQSADQDNTPTSGNTIISNITDNSDNASSSIDSEDPYRDAIAKTVRITEILQAIMGIITIVIIYRYFAFIGWKWSIAAFFISNIILGILISIFGINKYFGEDRLKKYDQLVSSAGKAVAIATLEGKSPGIIRKFVFLLIFLAAFPITTYVSDAITDHVMAEKFEPVVSYLNGITETSTHTLNTDGSKSIGDSIDTYEVGDIIQTNLFTLQVTDSYIVDDISKWKKVPEGANYVVIEYSYKNISKSPISSWNLPEVKLKDSNGAVYRQDADADWYFKDYSDEKILSDLNPGIKTKGSKIFEVSSDVLNQGQIYALFEADSNIIVELNLNSNSAATNINTQYDTSYPESNNKNHVEYVPAGEYISEATTMTIGYATFDNPDEIGFCQFANASGEAEYYIQKSTSDLFVLNDGYGNRCGTIKSSKNRDSVIVTLHGASAEFYPIEYEESAIGMDYLIPDSNARYLLPEELTFLDKELLRLVRNEIYARHGLIFKSEDLNNYFRSTSWYTGYRDNVSDSELNEYEKKNVELIKSLEETK